MQKTYRPELPPGMPERIARLPVHRGYPVPWFVETIDGEPDFRVIRTTAVAIAHNLGRCWICGEPRGRNLAFVIGPMCAVNRSSSEPPGHVDCADWSARACPFLARPHMRRNEVGMPEHCKMPGMGLRRNPGVAMVWICRDYRVTIVTEKDAREIPGANPGPLFHVGNPTEVRWYAEGRDATRAEIEHSIDTGCPALREIAELQGPRAVAALDRMVAGVKANLLPAA